ncbi:adenylyl-sulfate kinase [Anaerovorax odorimutans]|uniref:adenylyl-sulfate kinase n=1 Tax=Anaerovorax odorimutans TaxID=109327 RepID=UPI000418E4EC|nr:adenylyl-sulfate kinase [Anaerovorax odorimutans]
MDKIMDTSSLQQDMRVVFAGHVDHGKSTVIGRLLMDYGSLPEGKLEQIREKCRKTARPFEYAFLLDALKEEQSQGITIDSARCFFKTKNKNYILIDAPGHTEFIKNMVSGASRADAAVLVIDAVEGVRDNSKRHGVYLSLLGIEQVCILINKMDLVGYKKERFDEITEEYIEFLQGTSLKPQSFIPISGFYGDNIVNYSEHMEWYDGKTLLETLETLKGEEKTLEKPFRMPIQDIYKFTKDGDQRRIIAGTVDSGTLNIGDQLIFYPSEKKSRLKSIECFGKEKINQVTVGYATGFTLEEQLFLQRGEIAIKLGEQPPFVGRHIKTRLFWLGKQSLMEGKKYLFKIGTTKIDVKVEKILSIMDASNIEILAKNENKVERHEIAECILTLDKEIAFDTADLFPSAGRFVIVENYNISGGGIILENIKNYSETLEMPLFTQSGKVSYEERCGQLGQQGIVLWFTGLSGAGKSTIAIELERQLMNQGKLSFRLDGDNIRDGLNSDLGFSLIDRDENIRRVSETAKLFKESGMITLVSFISPLRSMREKAKNIIGELGFVEVYVKASFETCLARDTKGLYSKAMEGKIKNFTGVSSPYEEPDCPDLILDTEKNDIRECVEQVLFYLEKHFKI